MSALPIHVRFGCCSDGETAASGPEGGGCDANRECGAGSFGCCPDGVTFSQGPKNQGCFECPEEVKTVLVVVKLCYSTVLAQDKDNDDTGPEIITSHGLRETG